MKRYYFITGFFFISTFIQAEILKDVGKTAEKGIKTIQEGAKTIGKGAFRGIGTAWTSLSKPAMEVFSSTKVNPGYIPYIPPNIASQPNAFNVLGYNIFMRPRLIFDKDGQILRVRKDFLPKAIGKGYDALVFSEAFDTDARITLLKHLKELGYRYATPILGRGGSAWGNGGVIIVSPHPIVTFKEQLFGNLCTAEDCLANKGIMYAKINKNGKNYHIFGTHTQSQSGKGNADIRKKQFTLMKKFIDAQKIPSNEPVIIIGDLNVDMVSQRDHYKEMLHLLNASHPQLKGYAYSESGLVQALTGGKKIYDYILVSNQHASPKNTYNHIIPMLSPLLWKELKGDPWHNALSDHFPVHGYFAF